MKPILTNTVYSCCEIPAALASGIVAFMQRLPFEPLPTQFDFSVTGGIYQWKDGQAASCVVRRL
jgi:hypothetical protein